MTITTKQAGYMKPDRYQRGFMVHALHTWGDKKFREVTEWVLATSEVDKMDPIRSGHMLTILKAIGDDEFRTLVKSVASP